MCSISLNHPMIGRTHVPARESFVPFPTSTIRGVAPIHVVAAGRPPLCKISDFGLARIMTADNAYVTSDNMHALLPLRWMAPESVRDHVYTAGASTWHHPRGTIHLAAGASCCCCY
jgi:hypothetical protein